MPPPVQPTEIVTARLTLRPFRESDAPDVFEYASDPAFRKYAPYIPSDYSPADAVAYVQERLEVDWNQQPTFAVEHEGIRYVEQNPKTTSAYAARARAGARIIWVIRTARKINDQWVACNDWVGRIEDGVVWMK